MIKTVVREHHWTPETINSLFLDEIDCFGLKYWYDDILEVIKKMKEK